MKIGKLDITKWTYAGNKLNNPLIVAWKLFWFVPFKISLLITCLFAFLGFGSYAAKCIWDECK